MTLGDRRCAAVARYLVAAYPTRYPKMLVMREEGRVLVALERNEALDGSQPFATFIDLGAAEPFHETIEKARVKAEGT